ncbi:carbohydrate ABC transporter permease [Microbacterium sp. G2-8]|uniref:carbohydrate ABC transporter permease n=1 Tax=Microbacterium sp. G2-8 TaxID=2842454 RepID=UPI001C8AD441|nr:carbohydrate ABC transporter permease [Microbacterium sp. G2-8]
MSETMTLVAPTARKRPRPAGSTQSAWTRVRRGLLYVILIVAAAAMLTPFFWMLMSSLKDANSVFSVPVRWIPEVFVWENYRAIWEESDILTWVKNTLILSVTVTLLQVVTGSFAAYGFSRIRFPGRNALFLLYVATIAVPWQSYMIPQYIMISNTPLIGTLWSIVALQTFGAFGVFLMKQFYETIPEEMSEAGRLDGLSEYGIWWRIMVPLSIPAVASLSLLTFVNTWNDYLGPLLYLRDPSLWTLQLGLQNFVSSLYDVDYGVLFAGLVISVVPIAVIFLLGQRFFVEGIATSGMKG